MPFTKIEKHAGRVGPREVKKTVRLYGTGPGVEFVIPANVLAELGWETGGQIDVLRGTGNDEGDVLLRPSSDGRKLSPASPTSTSVKVNINRAALGVTGRKFSATEVSHEIHDSDLYVLLPTRLRASADEAASTRPTNGRQEARA